MAKNKAIKKRRYNLTHYLGSVQNATAF